MLLAPRLEKITSKAPVFYNPRMEFNRHLSILFLNVLGRRLGRGLRVCDLLTGCGVRGVRVALEVGGLEEVVVNDLNRLASRLARLNAERVGVSGLVKVRNMDGNRLLSLHSRPGRRFDYIDIDPFGSPILYVDNALRAVRNGGVLALTATDMAPLCGVHVKACVRRYWARPLRSEYCHEIALRILIGVVARTAAQTDLAVTPLLSHSTDHYIRAYLAIVKGGKRADDSLGRMGYIYHCPRCLDRKTHQTLFPKPPNRCGRCGGVYEVGGPLWLGDLCDGEMAREMLNEVGGWGEGDWGRVEKTLRTIEGEQGLPPTFFHIPKICKRLRISIPAKGRILAELQAQGYKATPTHFTLEGIKTTAPLEVLEEMMKKLDISPLKG